MSVNISPFGGVGWQFFDNNGVPLNGGLIYTYAAGTTTPQATYTTSTGNIAQSNPIVLDSTGRVPNGEIWLLTGLAYKFVLQTSASVLIATYDNITQTVSIVTDFTGNGSQTTFTLNSMPSNINNTNIFINGVYQQKNSYSITGTSLIFTQAPPITSVIEVVYI
jgi:hypothetical protein